MRLTLRRKISFSFILLTELFLLIIGCIALSYKQLETARDQHIRSTRSIESVLSLENDVQSVNVLLRQYTDAINPAKLDKIKEARTNTLESIAVLKRSSKDPEVLNNLAVFESLIAKRTEFGDKLVEAVNRGAPAEEVGALRQERLRFDDEARGYLASIVAHEKTAVQKSEEAFLKNADVFRSVLFISLVLYGLILLAVAAWLTRTLVTSLNKLTSMAENLGKGKLRTRTTVSGDDEVGVLAKTMNHMAKQLERLDEAKSDFVSLASHQLRTPATGISQYLGMLKQGYAGKLSPKQEKFVESAHQSNQTLLKTLDLLLNVAQFNAGTIRLDKRTQNISRLLSDVEKVIRPLTDSRGQKLTLNIPVKPIYATIDEQWLKMAIENIAENASKYTDEKGSIDISARKSSGKVFIRVKDNGMGIAEADIQKLFDKFSRAAVPNKHHNGSGLGLFLVSNIVRLHGGEVRVTSKLSKGTTFEIIIPS